MGKFSRAIILLGLITHSLTWSLVAADRPFWGYKTMPSARMMPAGRLLVSGQLAPKSHYEPRGDLKQQLHLSSLTNPLDWLELGATFSHHYFKDEIPTQRTGELGVKFQLPRLDSLQPYLALGVVDLYEADRKAESFYFALAHGLKWEHWHIFADVGSMYSSHRNIFDSITSSDISSFAGLSLDGGWVELLLEAQWYGRRALLWNASLWVKPLSPKPGLGQNLLALGAGYQMDMRSLQQNNSYWGGAQVQFPLERHASIEDSTPRIWLDFYPLWDHYYPINAENGKDAQWRVSLALDLATNLSVPGLHWVNSFFPTAIASAQTESLTPRAAWQRSYLNWDLGARWGDAFWVQAPHLGVGLLAPGEVGLQILQPLGLAGWPGLNFAARVVVDSTMETQRDFWASLPLHPQLPSFLQYSQLRCEGGYYSDASWRVLGQIAQGTERNHLVLGGGYDFTEELWVFEAKIRWAWGKTSVRSGPVNMAYAPILEHHLSAAHSIYHGVQGVAGNSKWRTQPLWQQPNL